MIKSFIISFKLKNTYRVNSIIYSIKSLPIINKVLPSSLYHNKGLKIFGNIISILIELCSAFLGKFLYVAFTIFSMLTIYKTNSTNTFLHIFTFLTIAGAILNTYMFNPTKDKYYALFIMNMDGRNYTLSNFYYTMLKTLIGFLPFTIIFGMIANIPLFYCILMPIFVIMMKMIVNENNISYFKKFKTVRNENTPSTFLWGIIALFVAISYGIPFLGYTINSTIFFILFFISVIFGIISFIKIHRFQSYKAMYKQLLIPSNLYFDQKQATTEILKNNVVKQIEYDENFTSTKSGYAYFHDLFVKRHRKILTKSAFKQTVILCLIMAFLFLLAFVSPEIGKKLNTMLLSYLPYFIFIIYIINRGPIVTQAMFMNCDHSMLTYKMYRAPKVILGLFKERLKTLIKINLIPSFVIAVGLPLLLFLTGGTDNYINYAVLFFSILAMSIFFSVHYLVMYYLLQPYNINTELKSSIYQVVQTLTYMVCYFMIQMKFSTILFGASMILFSVLYSFISLILVYRLAPKTFKIRM